MRGVSILTIAITAICALLSVAVAQSTPDSTRFAVASIRVHTTPVPSGGGSLSISGLRLTVKAYSVFGLIMYAYSIKTYMIEDAASLDHTMYDISALADDTKSPSPDDFRLMMQALLADRFRLRIHKETREMAVYALVVEKNGPKFPASAPDASATPTFETRGSNVERFLPKTTMAELADRIGSNAGIDRPVVDKTGLRGTYEVRLRYTPPWAAKNLDSDPAAVSVFTAVREQLGLRLEPRKLPMNVWVVDHVEKPSEN